MLEDSGMLDTYVGELLNKTKKRDDTSAVDELEPRGKLMIVYTKKLCRQSFSHNVYCRPDLTYNGARSLRNLYWTRPLYPTLQY